MPFARAVTSAYIAFPHEIRSVLEGLTDVKHDRRTLTGELDSLVAKVYFYHPLSSLYIL